MKEAAILTSGSRSNILNVKSLPSPYLHFDRLRLSEVLLAKGRITLMDRTFACGYLSHASLTTTLYCVCFFKADFTDF